MSVLSKPLASMEFSPENPLILSVMAYSAMIASCLDFTDSVTARDAFALFPVQKS